MSTTLRGFRLTLPLVALVLVTTCHGTRADGATPPSTPANTYQGSSPDAKALFTWLDTLGFPDVRGRAYVRVTTGWVTDSSGDERPLHAAGFLVSDTDTAITILSTGLVTNEYRKDSAQTDERRRVQCQRVDLAAEMTAHLQHLRKVSAGVREPDSPAEEALPAAGDRVFSDRAGAAVLAWICARSGLSDLARAYFELAPRLSLYDSGAKLPLRALLENELAHSAMWQAVLAFGDPAVTRAELLQRFVAIMARFPNSAYAKGTQKFGPSARDYAWLLRLMVAEDKEHARAIKPPGTPTVHDRVADLIFQLRDQNGYQFMQPGACDIFTDPRGEASPAHQLVKLGYVAVPQLIEAIGDRCFTRSVGYWRDFTYSHYVLRVGDCAETILERIAGRSFWGASYTNASMAKDDEAAVTKARVSAWWIDFQKKGEQQTLMEAVGAGGQDSSEQARRLLQQYPAAAGSAILRGVRAAKEPWIRGGLIHLAGALRSAEADDLLLNALETDPDLTCRVAAAEELFPRRPELAVPAMVSEWARLKPLASEFDGHQSVGPLVTFLVGVGGPDAIRALSGRLDGRPLYIREMVIDRCSDEDPFLWDPGWRPPDAPPPGEKRVVPPPTLAAIEDLLVGRLDDDGETNMTGSRGSVSFDHPRICDLAASALHERWPDKYSFDLSAPAPARDVQVLKCKNVWRAQRGLEPLPAPQRPQIALVAPARLRALLDAVLAAPTGSARTDALAVLEREGLGALPGLRDVLVGLAAATPAQLQTEARRLAFVVRVASISPKSLPPSQTMAERLAIMQGRPLEAVGFVGLVLDFVRSRPQGVGSLLLSVDRPGDDTGAMLTVCLGPVGQHDNSWIAASEWGRVGKHSILGAGGSMNRDYARTAEAWDDLLHGVGEALTAAPEVPVTIRVSIDMNGAR